MTFWQAPMAKWLDKRIPAATQFQLGLGNIFIFPSQFGWYFLALIFGLFLLGTNYQNNLMLLLCYFLLALMLVNLFASYLNFAKLTLHLGKTHHAFVDEPLHLPIWIKANGSAHGRLRLRFWRQSTYLDYDLDSANGPASLSYVSDKRGQLNLPRVTVESLFPLGFFRCWTHLAFQQSILIYPKPLACSLQLYALSQEGEQVQQRQVQGGADEFFSLHSYQRGEPLNRVAWKHLAKGQGMLSKEFANPVAGSVWLRLLPCSSDTLEKKLSQLSYQVLQLSQGNQSFGLDLGEQKIAPNSGLAHQQACLSALALFQLS